MSLQRLRLILQVERTAYTRNINENQKKISRTVNNDLFFGSKHLNGQIIYFLVVFMFLVETRSYYNATILVIIVI